MAIILESGLAGTVSEFDERAGLGVIIDSSGRKWPFHCISIADGSRRIDIGTRVVFADGLHVGRHEAVNIGPV